MSNCRLVVMVSGGGTNLQTIIDRCRTGKIAANIVGVISNNPNAGGLKRAKEAGIATFCIDHREFGDRESYDQALIACIDTLQPDLIVLAGFMRILTTPFVEHYAGRLLNIHPSLLPKYRGLHTHQRALDAGDTMHGASVHFVTAELDGGPVILQATVAIAAEDDAETLAARVLTQEHRIYAEAINWFAQGRLQCRDGRIFLDEKEQHEPTIVTADTRLATD